LSYLSTGPPDRLKPFLDLLMRRALESGREMEHLRALLAQVEPALLEPHLTGLVEEVIGAGDEAWDRYRRLAELLDVLACPALLRRVVEVAAQSDNADIREVAEDFPPDPSPGVEADRGR
jgi:hypothetical protein